MRRLRAVVTTLLILLAAPAVAQEPRDMLAYAAFQDSDVPVALERVRRARGIALAAAARAPTQEEPAVIAAVAQGYIAKLTGQRGEAMAARREFEAVARRFPRNPEAQMGIGAWHVAVINRVGRLIGRLVGAQRGTGVAALRHAVAMGGDRAMFAGMAGMMLVESDPADPLGRGWIERAATAPTPTVVDLTIQRGAQQIAAALRRGDQATAKTLADRLAPFGWHRPDKKT